MKIDIGRSYIAWAKDEEIRQRGASGGFVTAVMIAALKTGLVDHALVVKKEDVYEGTPCMTDDVNDIISSSGSLHSVPINLTKYVLKHGNSAIVMPAKPCDARGVIEQAKRNQVDLEKIYMLGLNCGGTMRPVTMMATAKAYGLDPDSVVSEEISKGKLILRTEDGEKAITMDELEEEGYGRRDACKSCSINIPKMADLACGNWGVPKERTGGATFVEVLTEKGKRIFINAVDAGYVEFEEASEKSVNIREKIDETMRELADEWYKRLSHGIDEFSREGRLSFYIETFSDCIECGSCRIVCPVCSCGEDSKCLGMNDERDAYKISAFHLIRLLHLMDSCIGCGQCEEVCPVDIPLTTVHRRFAERMQKKLDYTPGMDLRRPPFFETGLLEI